MTKYRCAKCPNLTGCDVCPKRERGGAREPVVAVRAATEEEQRQSLEAAAERYSSQPVPLDPRIRLRVGDVRAVAPQARQDGSRVYVNGVLVIEVRTVDGLGGESWRQVEKLTWRESRTETAERARFILLANGAADRELQP